MKVEELQALCDLALPHLDEGRFAFMMLGVQLALAAPQFWKQVCDETAPYEGLDSTFSQQLADQISARIEELYKAYSS